MQASPLHGDKETTILSSPLGSSGWKYGNDMMPDIFHLSSLNKASQCGKKPVKPVSKSQTEGAMWKIM